MAPPGSGAVAAASMTVTATAVRRFGAGERRYDPATRNFLESSVPASGVALDPADLDEGRGNGFREMTANVLRDAARGNRPDLLALAHAVPDFCLDDVAAIDAGVALGGVPASFAVSDRGTLAPFTALRLALSFAGRQRYTRAAVVALDQSSLPYRTVRAPSQEVHGDAAVALVLEPCSGHGTLLAGRAGLPPGDDDSASDALDAAVDALVARAGTAPGRVLVGAGVPVGWERRRRGAHRPEVVRAGRGAPCTGVWALLAETWSAGDGPALVVDADPVLGAVHAAVVGGDARS